jgi:hypothetical protein
MAKGIVTIDGVDLRLWEMEIKRGFAVTDSELSGRLKNSEMFRDIVGTFYNYTLGVEPHPDYREDYDTFYDIISAPVKFHTVKFPYGLHGTIEYVAYVTTGEDSDKPIENGEIVDNRWSGLSVQFIAKEPQRRP